MHEPRKFLRGRWKPETVQATSAELLAGRVASPFGDVSHAEVRRVDLRGFPLTEVFRGLELERVDLSEALVSSAGMLLDARFADCLFERADLDTNLTGQFERCSFRRTRLLNAMLGGAFTDCDFREANLLRARGSGCEFVRCDFGGASMRKANLLRSLFEECIWKDVRFYHSSLGGSRITEEGFPKELAVERSLRIAPGVSMPDLSLEFVTWLPRTGGVAAEK